MQSKKTQLTFVTSPTELAIGNMPEENPNLKTELTQWPGATVSVGMGIPKVQQAEYSKNFPLLSHISQMF